PDVGLVAPAKLTLGFYVLLRDLLSHGFRLERPLRGDDVAHSFPFRHRAHEPLPFVVPAKELGLVALWSPSQQKQMAVVGPEVHHLDGTVVRHGDVEVFALAVTQDVQTRPARQDPARPASITRHKRPDPYPRSHFVELLLDHSVHVARQDSML